MFQIVYLIILRLRSDVGLHSATLITSRSLDLEKIEKKNMIKTRSSWHNRALRDDEAVYWVSKRHYEAVAVGN